MATVDVAKSLKKMGKLWSKTEAKSGGGYTRLADGKYVTTLTGMKVGESKKGRLQVGITFKVTKPKENKGKEVMKFYGLDNENNIAYFKGFAEVIGLELPDDVEDLPEAVASFVEDFEDSVTIQLKTNGDFQNLSLVAVGDAKVNEDASEDGEDESEDEDESESEDESEGEDEGEGEDEDGDEDGEDEDEAPRRKKKKTKKSRR